MKLHLLFITSALAVLGSIGLAADAKPAPSAEFASTHETADLKVLKVYSAADGPAVFRAYVVEWKGREVIVPDTLANTNYGVGDPIRVLVMNQPYPQGWAPYRLLHFAIIPQR